MSVEYDVYCGSVFAWCEYLAAQEGVEPQLYADNLKCVSRDPLGSLLGRDWTLTNEGDR